MKLQTPVTDAKCQVPISFSDKIMMLGSCFSDNIGNQLKDFGFDVCVNPFGTLYNPISIRHSIALLLENERFSEHDCIMMGSGAELFCSFRHHTSFARRTREDFLENANAALEQARAFFRNCSKVIITLGTSWCFRHLQNDEIVSNCLKRDAREFAREMIPAEGTAETLVWIMKSCPDKEFIFTVSPIRHFKDGAHGNQLSKASLLLGIDKAIARAEKGKADYFPAYEIVMDELRDYRFYAEDMCHPSPQATDYIRERFTSWALPESEQETLKENIRTFRRGCHKDLFSRY